jgi:hypothetical protein
MDLKIIARYNEGHVLWLAIEENIMGVEEVVTSPILLSTYKI